ncbi:unnamed protein product [Schistosoma margrebowiei]|uniref:Uncharacterized protein n=1 Tax=Schistosoma margrebowiei TaxID=48269 RepID=A0A3P8EI90_9TREM|nr:unnamed protein product [Schistosoma margrebowiei]
MVDLTLLILCAGYSPFSDIGSDLGPLKTFSYKFYRSFYT